MDVTTAQLCEIANDYGLNDGDVRVDYSGRGMYGTTCVGFVIDGSEFGLAITMYDVLGEDVRDLTPSTDNMGRSTIVYFPNLHLAEGETWIKDDSDE